MRRTNRRVFVYLLIVVFCLGYGGRFLFSDRAIEHAAAYIMYPILLAQNKIVIPIKAYFEKRRTQQELEALVNQLQQERETLIADNIQLQSMLSFSYQTQELLEFKKQYALNDAVMAQILVKHFSDQSHYILIDKGLNAGIEQDMVAIYKNCLLGRVIEVYPHYSKIVLVTDRLCKVAAFCPHTRASGIHQDANQERQTQLQFVSHLSDIDPDDLVLSSGDGLIFPKGFALGKIKSCATNGLFYDVAIEPLLDVRKINFCFIVQKGGKQLNVDHAFIACTETHVTSTHEEIHVNEIKHEVLVQQKKEHVVAERIAMLHDEQGDVN